MANQATFHGGGEHGEKRQERMTFGEVYAQQFRFVWRSLRRLGVPESDAADAVQDVFLVVHRRLPEFEGRSKITTWLYSICFHVARDRRKLAHMRRRAHDDEPLLDCADDRADVGAQAERRQAIELLEIILDELPLEQRAVFTLFELDGMRGEDVAELLDVPLGTVYSRLRLARDAFRRAVARLNARDQFRVGGPPVTKSQPVLKAAAVDAGISSAERAPAARGAASNVLPLPGVERQAVWKQAGGER
ncbi:RNA polymerase sigma factor [Sorangium sp. So ce1024]|uniref:RNA polymerase sigma factor n=2 Tax=unclassified Sorangium TaxID=2621164 RepID=UPI003F0C8832